MESIYFLIKTEFSNDLSQKSFCSVLLLCFKYVSTMPVIFFSAMLRVYLHLHSHPLRQSLSLNLQLPCIALPLSNCLTSSNIESLEILNSSPFPKGYIQSSSPTNKENSLIT